MTKASKKNKKRRAVAEESRQNLSAAAASTAEDGSAAGDEREKGAGQGGKGASSKRRAKGISGVPGSKNDARRCTATAHRTGERCRAPAIKGGNVCRVHGGAAPQVKKAGRERLLEMVEPAMVQLRRIIDKPGASDADKLKAITLVLDRTGYRPGVILELKDHDPWADLLDDALDVDRSELVEIARGHEELEQLARDVARDHRDMPRQEPYDGEVVPGQVVPNTGSPIVFGDEQERPLGPTEFDPGQGDGKTRLERVQDAIEEEYGGDSPGGGH